MKILLSNGPASSGKDTLARYIIPNQNGLFPRTKFYFERFSRPHKEAFAAMTGAKIDEWYNVEGYEERKDEVIPWLGVSYRQWQIDFSEYYMKVKYGKDIFTRMFYDRIKAISHPWDSLDHDAVVVVSDCGFTVELESLLRYGVRPEDILLMRLHRPGYTFAGDSRSYIYSEQVLSCDIKNNSNVDVYHHRVTDVIKHWLFGAGASNAIFDYKDEDRP